MKAMEFKIGQMKQQPMYKNTYKLEAEFDDGNQIIRYINNKEHVELMIYTYDKYCENLSKNWNKYCNPESEDVIDYFEEAIKDLGLKGEYLDENYIYDLAYAAWSSSTEYECKARFDNWVLTYFDANGIEYEVNVEKFQEVSQ